MQLRAGDLAKAFARPGRYRSREVAEAVGERSLDPVSSQALLRVGRSTVLYFLYPPDVPSGGIVQRSWPSLVKSRGYTRAKDRPGSYARPPVPMFSERRV